MNMVMKGSNKEPDPDQRCNRRPEKASLRTAKRPPKPLNAARMRDLALYYAGRFATTQNAMRTYLRRKVRERGWEDSESEPIISKEQLDQLIDDLVQRMVELGYIDDASFARAKADGLVRRGYGGRRVEAMLYQSKISEDDAAEARDIAVQSRWSAAVQYARKRRLGPYARDISVQADPALRKKALAAFLRAGHGFAEANRLLAMAPGDPIQLFEEE
jgi:regulatory protein